MPSREKKTADDFLSHKVKDYAEYREFMRPHNSGFDLSTVKFRPAKLSHNKAL